MRRGGVIWLIWMLVWPVGTGEAVGDWRRSIPAHMNVYEDMSRTIETRGERVTYRSLDPRIAEVSVSGQLRAQRPGKTIVLITSQRTGKRKLLYVTVKGLPPIKVNDRRVTLAVGRNTYADVDTPMFNLLRYTSSDRRVVEVTAHGLIRAKRPGQARVIVSYGGKLKPQHLTVTVRP